jgi:hypothetical protein
VWTSSTTELLSNSPTNARRLSPIGSCGAAVTIASVSHGLHPDTTGSVKPTSAPPRSDSAAHTSPPW